MATKLNGAGRSHANSLIASGKVDKSSSWSFSADDGNSLLGGKDGSDWSNYGSFHLGIDTDEANDTRGHYKYPFGKGGKIYRSGVIAIKSRAAAQDATDIANAAGALLEKIDGPDKEEKADRDMMRSRALNLLSGTAVVPGKTWYNFSFDPDNPGEASMNIFDEIGMWGVTAANFCSDLAACKANVIHLGINSPGGSVFDGLAIYNGLVQHPAKVNVNVNGWAASIASVIAMAGDNISVAENAMMMIHKPFSFVMGSADDMRAEADVLDGIQKSTTSIYAKRTGMKVGDINDMVNDETWMDAKECVANGFADSMIPNKGPPDPATNMSVDYFDQIFKLPEGMRVALARKVVARRLFDEANPEHGPLAAKFNLETATERELERVLRSRGFSRSESAQMAHGLKAPPRDVGRSQKAPTVPPRDAGGKQARSVLRAMKRLAMEIKS